MEQISELITDEHMRDINTLTESNLKELAKLSIAERSEMSKDLVKKVTATGYMFDKVFDYAIELEDENEKLHQIIDESTSIDKEKMERCINKINYRLTRNEKVDRLKRMMPKMSQTKHESNQIRQKK